MQQSLGTLENQSITITVWPDGIPTYLPKVDYLLIPRKNLAPRKWFRKQEDTTFVAWHIAEPILMKHGQLQEDGAIELCYVSEPPPDIAHFVRNLPTNNHTIQGFAADQLLEKA